jgi:hypothetical protein
MNAMRHDDDPREAPTRPAMRAVRPPEASGARARSFTPREPSRAVAESAPRVGPREQDDRRTAPTQPCMPAVRPRPESSPDALGDRPTPVDHGFMPDRPGRYRSLSAPASTTPSDDRALAALAAEALHREGPTHQAVIIGRLMDHGISRTQALSVIQRAVTAGAIARDSNRPIYLRAPSFT